MSPKKKRKNIIIAAIIIITLIISIFMINMQSEKNKQIEILKSNEVQTSIRRNIHYWEEAAGLKPGSYIKKLKILYDSVWRDGGGQLQFDIVFNDNDEKNKKLYLHTIINFFVSENKWGQTKIEKTAGVHFPLSTLNEMEKMGENKDAK